MDATDERNIELIADARGTCSKLKKAAGDLKRLESEVQELIERLRWHQFLGYDRNTVEFIKNLDLAGQRDLNH